MSLRDRVPKVEKSLQRGQMVQAKHPRTKKVSTARVVLPYRYTTILDFDQGDRHETWIVANADIEENVS